ncbi:MBL fold metallo-hydrolase [Anaerovorax odorimutans]|uniref:MBL fold metallo-hydrolase n=1 Tax=Anaerovorax odorimutans TaxID=109327 RepID=A0ABT1RJF8_9FIRM|nr:MBL fold metallo-hydrolase [Anaerovorax odorimutans]MCQ4635320.1 MBL fold metallo-hydrolase [Anaerovorax odorimutans]
MKIKRFIGGVLESNGYVIYQNEGGSCFVIDPGYNSDRFVQYIQKMDLKPEGILLTHHHYDHTGAVKKLKNEFDCPVFLHREDMDIYKEAVEHPLEDGEAIMLEDEELRVIHTPGHTRGSVCFYSEKSKTVFTGDTIFNVDLGRTDLEDGCQEDMVRSCRDIIDKWSNEIYIYPGHGDGCNMKKVRRLNKEFLDIVGEES